MYKDSYEIQDEKQHAVVDYLDRGLWGLCLASRNSAREGIVDTICDWDTDLNSLIVRAVEHWGYAPHNLWVSECAREIVSYSLNSRNIGD